MDPNAKKQGRQDQIDCTEIFIENPGAGERGESGTRLGPDKGAEEHGTGDRGG